MKVLNWQGRELPSVFWRECQENEFTIGEEVTIRGRHFRVINKEYSYIDQEYVRNADSYWTWEAKFEEIGG